MAALYPVIGQWFTRPNGTLFEVVAVDETGGTVELQQFDGTLDEIDMDSWPDLFLVEASPPGSTTRWSSSTASEPRRGPLPYRLAGPLT